MARCNEDGASALFAGVPPTEGSRLTLTLGPRAGVRLCCPVRDFSPPAHPRRVFFVLLQKAMPPGSITNRRLQAPARHAAVTRWLAGSGRWAGFPESGVHFISGVVKLA